MVTGQQGTGGNSLARTQSKPVNKILTVAYINQYDEPDHERAKMQISKWLNTSERGIWLRDRFTRLRYNIEPDGGMEPHYMVELEVELNSRDYLMYVIRWPDAVMVDSDSKESVLC